MGRFIIVIITFISCFIQCQGEEETILSAVLTPDNSIRKERSYYERYGYGRPYDRLDDGPSRCGRCDDDDDDDDYDRGRDRDDDRRSNRPSHGSRHGNRNDDDDRRYDNDRKSNKTNTDDDSNDKKRPYDDDKDRNRHSSRKNKNRNRYDDRDRYRPDYYDRFLRDPYRDRYDDPYSRRPYDRYPYEDYGRYDQFSNSGYRRPYYEDRYDRYDDSFGGYGPGVGRGPHDSFRPWDETYRGQAGWDSGGRGYYFASGRPDASTWVQREYSRPAASNSGWQNLGYSTGYRDPGYRTSGYGSGNQDSNSGYGYGYGYGQSSGWRNVGVQRPYRDQRQRVCRSRESMNSGVANLDRKQPDNRYGQNQAGYGPSQNGYGQNQAAYGPSQNGYGQIITYQPGSSQSSTTQATSYLFQRNDDIVTQPETTVLPS